MAIGYVKESDYMNKCPPQQPEMVGKMTETQSPRTSSNTAGKWQKSHMINYSPC